MVDGQNDHQPFFADFTPFCSLPYAGLVRFPAQSCGGQHDAADDGRRLSMRRRWTYSGVNCAEIHPFIQCFFANSPRIFPKIFANFFFH